jgi:hypothetical protein
VAGRTRKAFSSTKTSVHREEVYFQCQSMECRESLSFPLPLELYHSSITSHPNVGLPSVFPVAHSYNSPLELLKRISEYFVKDLSRDSDALDAIRGVFELFRLSKKPVYSFCGLPIFSLEAVNHSDKALETIRVLLLVFALCSRSVGKLYRRSFFPSWTWAGWKSGNGDANVDFEVLNLIKSRDSISILESFSLPSNIAIETTGGHGVVLDWKRDFEKILHASRSEDFLGPLKITSWTFSFSLQFRQQWIAIPDLPFASEPVLDLLATSLQQEQNGLQVKDTKVVALLLFHSKYPTQVAKRWHRTTAGLLFLAQRSQSNFERLAYYTAEGIPDLLDVGYQEYVQGRGIFIKYQQVCIV